MSINAVRATAAVLALATAVGCGTNANIYRAEPTPAPSATLRGIACVTPRPSLQVQRRANALVTVDAHPTGLTAFWIPGLNQRPCRTLTRRYGSVTASRLAEDIRHSPKYPKGTFNCGADDGSAVDLYFTYPAAQRAEYVRVGLKGCVSVGAPARANRQASPVLLRDLVVAAPAPWASALREFAS